MTQMATTFKRNARVALCGALVLGSLACGSSPTSPTAPVPATATIDSVVTSYRGVVVESEPIVIEPSSVLEVEVKLTVAMPAESRMTIYLCVMESPSSIGVGACTGVTATVREFLRDGPLRMGISPLKSDGVARTTSHVYVGVTEGAVPWPLTGSSPPQRGETIRGSRVLATAQVARIVTFR